MGLFQDLYFRINDQQNLGWHFWYNNMDREVQPRRNDLQSEDELQNSALRTSLDWTWSTEVLTGNSKLAYTRDDQVYNSNDRVILDRWFASYEMEWSQVSGFFLKAGVQANHLIAHVDAYKQRIKETRPDLFISAFWEPHSRFQGGINLRAPMVNGQFKPFSPLLSIQYNLLETPDLNFTWDTQAGRSFRMPTLNDRYWQPGGNPQLQPETSYSVETGLGLDVSGKVNYQGKLRFFMNRVQDWIIWIPGGREENPDGSISSYWFPDNIKEVSSKGIESYNSFNFRLPNKKWRFTLGANASYLRAINKSILSIADRSLNKQLPYTPKWTVNGIWQVHYARHAFGVFMQYRGPRYLEANNELPPLAGYSLWKLQISTRGVQGPVQWQVRGSVNNLFDLAYENFENRAMPGRSYNLSVCIKY